MESLAFQKQGRWLFALAAIGLAGVFLFFTRGGEAGAVRVAEATQETFISAVSTNGKVEASDSHELRAGAPGFVRRVAVQEGDEVKTGQLLLELERGEAQAEAARAQADLQAAEAELQIILRGGSSAEQHQTEQKLREARAAREEAARTLAANERLLERNAISRFEVEQSRERLQRIEREAASLEKQNAVRFGDEDRRRAEARVNSARAALAQARSQLRSARVTAPAGGIVYSLPVREGNFVNTGDLLARVGRMDRVRVRVFVDEPELGRVTPGQEVRVTWDALPGVRWTGAVERVPAEVTTLGARSVGEVICTISNTDRKLLANVNVDVQIIVHEKPRALTLPKEAVLRAGAGKPDGEHFVYVIEGSVLRRRGVKVGASSATRVEVMSGLEAGQRVALPGETPLEDGMRVRITG